MQVVQTDGKQTQLVYDIDTQQVTCLVSTATATADSIDRAAAVARQRGWTD